MPTLAPARRRGFTLVELLVVLAIIAILSGLLFPVFLAAKRSAQATSCLARFSAVGKATLLYTGDYDDRLMPVNHGPGLPPDPLTDRVWPQILLPYVRSFRLFSCPTQTRDMGFGGAFDPDLLPGDYAARYYDAALHADLGYNAYYLAPIVREGAEWVARPNATTDAERPSQTLLFVESVGSYLVSPPCRYAPSPSGGVADTFVKGAMVALGNQGASVEALYTPILGWNDSDEASAFSLGGVAARHSGRANVARLDGSVRGATIAELGDGCEVRPAWAGPIVQTARYVWSLSGPR